MSKTTLQPAAFARPRRIVGEVTLFHRAGRRKPAYCVAQRLSASAPFSFASMTTPKRRRSHVLKNSSRSRRTGMKYSKFSSACSFVSPPSVPRSCAADRKADSLSLRREQRHSACARERFRPALPGSAGFRRETGSRGFHRLGGAVVRPRCDAGQTRPEAEGSERRLRDLDAPCSARGPARATRASRTRREEAEFERPLAARSGVRAMRATHFRGEMFQRRFSGLISSFAGGMETSDIVRGLLLGVMTVGSARSSGGFLLLQHERIRRAVGSESARRSRVYQIACAGRRTGFARSGRVFSVSAARELCLPAVENYLFGQPSEYFGADDSLAPFSRRGGASAGVF